jgi:penicillin-binding protein 1A
MNRKEAISEVTAYNMTRMMEGPVTRGTAAGLMQRLGAVEMGGKTGTTNDNADAWFMGYVPQLMAGAWIGCDDRFIRIESGLGFGGQAARPIWEAFFKKVYADKTLGVDKEARFVKPADLMNESNSADISSIIEETVVPGAEGEDVGAGDASDFGTLDTSNEYIPAESQAPDDDITKPAPTDKKRDSSSRKGTKIGDPQPADAKKKKGFFKRVFGGKKEESANDY